MMTADKNVSPNTKYFRIAEITLAIEADLPLTEATFDPKYKIFEVPGPGKDNVRIRHHFSIPEEIMQNPGKKVLERDPWKVFDKDDRWVYLASSFEPGDKMIYELAVFTKDYSEGDVYHPGPAAFEKGGRTVLTIHPTDQIILAPILAARNACYIHSSGIVLNGKGYLFIGHSEAGKSTMVKIMKSRAEILCDDRVVVRRWPEGFRIHGTWSHGEMPDISPNAAALKGIFLLIKDTKNRFVPVEDTKEVFKNLVDCLVKSYTSGFWWDKMLLLNSRLAKEVPFYELYFDKSGKVADLLDTLE
jgi:hypothetical protein